jgi:hypothetical protein
MSLAWSFIPGRAGAADMVITILHSLVIQLTTPYKFCGRTCAVNAMFVISGPMLGQFEPGLVAGLLTPEFLAVKCSFSDSLFFIPNLCHTYGKLE